jgi:hypothetical protein
MLTRHRIVLGIVLVAIAAACSDANSPSTPPTLTMFVSTDTVAVGDTVAATATARQAQGFNYVLDVAGEFGGGTLNATIDSTPGGSTSITIRVPVVAPQNAVGQYIRFVATDSAYGFPSIQTIDSAFVIQ